MDDFFDLDADGQKDAIKVHAGITYDCRIGRDITINEYHISTHTEYTADFRHKLARINAVLDTFHYDDSNGMVDYFDTNFYRNAV